MQMSKFLSACMIVLLLVGWGITPGDLAAQESMEVEAGDSGGVDKPAPPEGEMTKEEATKEGEITIVGAALGAGTNRVDKYRLTCFAGCACARATLDDPAGGPAANRFVATLVGDFDAGDGSFFAGVSSVATPLGGGNSGTAQVCQGPGQYEVDVYKNTAFAESYNANLRCVFPGGIFVCGHSLVIIQNQ